MKRKLPRYKISIDQSLSENGEDLGITQIAYVESPAIMTKGVYFTEAQKMAFKDNLKMRVAAPALIPDLPIYRFDDEIGEYEVIFDKETIEDLVTKFKMNLPKYQFNLDHNSEELTAPSYILNDWFVENSETDQSFTKYGIKVPEGSWFVVSQFTDAEYFKSEIIDKDRAAYSIEGFLGLALEQIKQKLKAEKMNKTELEVNAYVELPVGKHTIEDKIYTVVEVVKNEGLEDEYRMNIIESIVPMGSENNLKKEEKMEKVKFEMAKLADGTPVWISALEVDGEVFIVDENMERAPIFDGEHQLEDGTKVSTVDGKITEVIAKAEDAPVVEDAPVAEVAAAEDAPIDAPVVDVVEETPAEGSIDEAKVMEIIQPKLDEIYSVIAELKTLIETANVSNEPAVDVTMSHNEKFNTVLEKLRNMNS